MMQHTHAYQDFNRFISTPYWMEFTLFFSLVRMCWYKFSYQSVVFALFFLYAELLFIKYSKTIFEYVRNKFPMPQLAPFSSWGWRGLDTSPRTGPKSYKKSSRPILWWLWGRRPASDIDSGEEEDDENSDDNETSDKDNSSTATSEDNFKED